MPAERAGYTVTMFVVDVSPSMGKTRTIEHPDGPNGQKRSTQITNLQWALRYVMLKVQEMIYNGRKTDQCGVILFGTEGTNNIVHSRSGGYEHVTEYIRVGQPNAGTLAKLAVLEASTDIGDPIDGIIVGIQTQAEYLAKKPTWTRRMIVITDGESPMELDEWQTTTAKMNELKITTFVVGVDFDDPDIPFEEEDKTDIKRENERFWHEFVGNLENGVIGTCAFALQDTARPDIKETKSAALGTVLRIGDLEGRPEEAAEILVRTAKATAIARPTSMKKFARREKTAEGMDIDGEDGDIFVQLNMRTDYVVNQNADDEKEHAEDNDEEEQPPDSTEKIEKDRLVRAYKYGATWVPIPDEEESGSGFDRLGLKKGIEIIGFFPQSKFRRDWAMSEVQYVWPDAGSGRHQVALSSMVQAMQDKDVYAICRWISRDGSDPKMGVLKPVTISEVDCFLFVQMPFAEDVRKYGFASLDRLFSKRGVPVTKHALLPTKQMTSAMDDLVDALDLMQAGDKTEEGDKLPWYDPVQSYNPALHRIKQALFHAAVVPDLTSHPLPPPHPDLVHFFEPPEKLVKRARKVIEACKEACNVKLVPAKVAAKRKQDHLEGINDDHEGLLLEKKPLARHAVEDARAENNPEARPAKKQRIAEAENSATEDEDEELLLPPVKRAGGIQMPTPARSLSPELDPGRAPGRLVGTTLPLNDFRANIAKGDVVTKAVQDLGQAIRDIVLKPFSSRRTEELLLCMKEMRQVALKEDEIDQWNRFLRDLKEACLRKSPPNNAKFWGDVQTVGRPLSLISDMEAKQAGGSCDIPEAQSLQFLKS